MQKYSMLKPELLKYCDDLIKKHPEKRQVILDVLDYFDSCMDKHIACPPNDWVVEECKPWHVLLTNDLFFINIYLEDGWYYVLVDSVSYFTDKKTFQLPFSFRRGRYDAKLWCTSNMFDALDIAFDLRQAVDNRVMNVKDKQFLPKYPYGPVIESDENKVCMMDAMVGEWLENN